MDKFISSADKAEKDDLKSSLIGDDKEQQRQNVVSGGFGDHFKPFLWMNLTPK